MLAVVTNNNGLWRKSSSSETDTHTQCHFNILKASHDLLRGNAASQTGCKKKNSRQIDKSNDRGKRENQQVTFQRWWHKFS